MLNALVVGTANAKRNDPVYILDNNSGYAADILVWRIQAHGHVAAADVKADARDADLLLVSDHAANRLGIAKMTISADHAGHGITNCHAVTHLRQRIFVVLTEHL